VTQQTLGLMYNTSLSMKLLVNGESSQIYSRRWRTLLQTYHELSTLFQSYNPTTGRFRATSSAVYQGKHVVFSSVCHWKATKV